MKGAGINHGQQFEIGLPTRLERSVRGSVHTSISMKILILVTALLLLQERAVFASGSSINRLPTPGAGAADGGLDREKFGLGQKIFNGSVELTGHEPAAAQKEKLQTLQSRLPENVAGKLNLAQLAGKLLPRQLDALEYFVTQRYPSK